jgi:hypothetical protein
MQVHLVDGTYERSFAGAWLVRNPGIAVICNRY